MLLYLASNSRPDISFAVHQCARFTHNTRAIHEDAVLRICRYLKNTSEDGLIYKPTYKTTVDCYADADFAGLWGVKDPEDPVVSKSRMGYTILLANCPILWVSKLQTETALSTLHAEYVALSQSCRDLVPIKDVVKELATNVGIDKSKVEYTTKSTCFEDNQGALVTAKCPKFTPGTKFIAVKYHWFQELVNTLFKIKKVDTKEQKADIFTKGLQGDSFLRIRKLLCGW